MPTLRSASAVDFAVQEQKPEKHNATSDSSRNERESSVGSSSSGEDLIAYDTNKPERDENNKIRTSRQKVDRRPASTFHKKKFMEMAWHEKLCNLATCPPEMHYLKEEHMDRGPIPTQPIWKENAFILSRAMLPVSIQLAAYYFFPDYKWPFALAYGVYFLGFVNFALNVVWRLNYYCTKLGTFDEKQIGRDQTPDKSTANLARGILAYMAVRSALPFFLHYDRNVAPLTDVKWDFPIRLGLWEIVMDYFFYVYHRSTHEIDALWFVHQHHHTTKHPTAILSILAEEKQEYLEVFLVPLAASLLVPMSFTEHWLTLCYTIYVEMLGHSGVRSYWAHPVLTYVLRPFGMELAVEDHDLHHRFGKSGRNYGKQTRFWDRIFGTVAERIETFGI